MKLAYGEIRGTASLREADFKVAVCPRIDASSSVLFFGRSRVHQKIEEVRKEIDMRSRISISFCAIGAVCTTISYVRYRLHSGESPLMSQYWPLSGIYFLGPFIIAAFATIWCRGRSETPWAIITGAIVIACISMVDGATNVAFIKDSEIGAGIRLCCVSWLQYPISLLLLARSYFPGEEGSSVQLKLNKTNNPFEDVP